LFIVVVHLVLAKSNSTWRTKNKKTEKWFQEEKSNGKQPEMQKTWKSQIPERFSFKKNITEQLKDQNFKDLYLSSICVAVCWPKSCKNRFLPDP
jgi:hypothetical protein